MGKIDTLIKSILSWLETYKKDTNCKGVVVGLSGGKDSTTVAMLAKKIWGNNVVALLLPNGTQTDIDDSLKIAKKLKLKFFNINIWPIFASFLNAIETESIIDDDNEIVYTVENGLTVSPKALTNIPPRIRMTVLYAVAQSLGYRVIGTGNKSESFIGWCTKWGDSAYDFNPIGNLTCTEVKEIGKILAREFGLDEKYITKSPADGLTGKTDEDNFGFSYSQLDNYIQSNGLDSENASPITEKIREMHLATEHKRLSPPVYKP